jgi:hypothetical protein
MVGFHESYLCMNINRNLMYVLGYSDLPRRQIAANNIAVWRVPPNADRFNEAAPGTTRTFKKGKNSKNEHWKCHRNQVLILLLF